MPREKPSQRSRRCSHRPRISSNSSASRCARRGLGSPQARDEFEIFERVELVVERGLVGQPRHDSLGLERPPARVDAEDFYLAAVRGQQTRDHPQRRRLARAIGAKQGVELAGAHREIEPVDRRLGEALAQVAQIESGRMGGIVDITHQSLGFRYAHFRRVRLLAG